MHKKNYCNKKIVPEILPIIEKPIIEEPIVEELPCSDVFEIREIKQEPIDYDDREEINNLCILPQSVQSLNPQQYFNDYDYNNTEYDMIYDYYSNDKISYDNNINENFNYKIMQSYNHEITTDEWNTVLISEIDIKQEIVEDLSEYNDDDHHYSNSLKNEKEFCCDWENCNEKFFNERSYRYHIKAHKSGEINFIDVS